jgi:ribonuclease VapC
MRPPHVLDSYCLLAWLEGEPGGATVDGLLQEARSGAVMLAVCTINLGEVVYIVERKASVQAAQVVLAAIDGLPVTQVDASRSLVLDAAHLKALHRMSYADCFAVALAKQSGALLVTGDPELREQDEVELVWIGR